MKQDKDTICLGEIPRKTVLVIGDIMLNQHIIAKEKLEQTDSPYPVIASYDNINKLAASARIALMIKKLGVSILLAGMVGKDEEGATIKRMLRAEGIPLVLGLYSRPTSVRKTISICDKPILGLEGSRGPHIKAGVFQSIIQLITLLSEELSTIIICDYGRGLISDELIVTINECCRHKDINTIGLVKNMETDNRIEKYKGLKTIVIDKTLLKLLDSNTFAKTEDIEATSLDILKKTGSNECLLVWDTKKAYLCKRDKSLVEIGLSVTDHAFIGADELLVTALTLAYTQNLTIDTSLDKAYKVARHYHIS